MSYKYSCLYDDSYTHISKPENCPKCHSEWKVSKRRMVLWHLGSMVKRPFVSKVLICTNIECHLMLTACTGYTILEEKAPILHHPHPVAQEAYKKVLE